METVACNFCQSSSNEPLFTVPDLYLDKSTILYTYVKCLKCGLVYQNPRPTLKEVGEAYPNNYEVFNFDKKKSWLGQKSLQFGIDGRCKIITNAKPTSGRLVDVGCSTGLFLARLQSKYGWESFGVEVNEYPARLARDLHHVDVFQGTLEQASYPANFFDAVTFWDVLEHLPDPSSTLVEVKRVLKPDGILVLRVPNFDSWDAKIFGPAWAGLDAPRHNYVFSRESLSLLLKKNGFKVTTWSCKIGGYPMFAISLRFWMKLRKIRLTNQRIINKLFDNPITQIALAPIFFINGQLLRGGALTVIASVRIE